MTVDWILARVRSGVNVMSDMLVAILLHELEMKQPTEMQAIAQPQREQPKPGIVPE